MRVMLFRFLRPAQIDPLQVAMTGVRMGERVVQLGCDDATLLAGLAAKVGMSGSATALVRDEREQEAATRAAARAGVLVDIRLVSPPVLGLDDGSADVVVVDDTRGHFAALAASLRIALLTDCRRLLRDGGRLEVVEGLGRGGLLGGAVTRPPGYDVAVELSAAGLAPVRVLAERDYFRFIEGLRVAPR